MDIAWKMSEIIKHFIMSMIKIYVTLKEGQGEYN